MTASTSSPAPNRSAGKRRTLYWPGFVVGLLLCTALSLVIVAAIIGFDNLSLANLQDGGTSWTPPTVAPTEVAVVAESNAGTFGGQENVANTFQLGEQPRNITSSRVNVRRSPGYQSKPADDVLASMQPGESVEILGGSALADDLIWWRVRYVNASGNLVEGWVAEATASGVQILGR